MMKLSIFSLAVALFLVAGPVHAELTGCLTPGGTLIHVAVGDSPAKPCTGQSVEVTFGAGGEGLTADDFYRVKKTLNVTIPANSNQELVAECNAGDVAVSGGFYFFPGFPDFFASGSGFIDDLNVPGGPYDDGWAAIIWNQSGAARNVDIGVTAVCAPAAP